MVMGDQRRAVYTRQRMPWLVRCRSAMKPTRTPQDTLALLARVPLFVGVD